MDVCASVRVCVRRFEIRLIKKSAWTQLQRDTTTSISQAAELLNNVFPA